jgi:NAD(P)-dependent dehydrogenase (short-subunit alcohol dehydrogenase family)
MDHERTAVVFGARRLGGHIAAHYARRGWQVAAVSRTQEVADAFQGLVPEAVGRQVDLSVPGAAAALLGRVQERHGAVDLIVNAISDPAVSSAALARENQAREALASPIGRAVAPIHHVVDAAVELMRGQGHGTFVQITGGLALRARRGVGALAATGYATRALIEGAIADAREDNVHVALLVIRGLIESDLTVDMLEGKPANASMEHADVIAAIDFLQGQSAARAWTHEVTLTPPGAAWQD